MGHEGGSLGNVQALSSGEGTNKMVFKTSAIEMSSQVQILVLNAFFVPSSLDRGPGTMALSGSVEKIGGTSTFARGHPPGLAPRKQE